MTNRYISVLPNNDFVTRGNFGYLKGRIRFLQHEDEQLDYTIDLKRWLASGETVSSSTATSSGISVSNLTDNSDNVTFTVSGVSNYGELDLLVTTSASQKKIVRLAFCRPEQYDNTDYVG